MSAAASPVRPAFGLPGRIQAPNSRPRSIALVGLGAGGGAVARAIEEDGAGPVDIRVFAGARAACDDALAAIKSDGDELHRALQEADMIFVVACEGDDVSLGTVVARIARSRNAAVTAIYLVAPGTDTLREREDTTLKALRAGVQMLVVATDPSYVRAMVAALGS